MAKQRLSQTELKNWILEELDQNLRLFTAIEAFRFKSELLPNRQLRRMMLHHHYLLRMLERCNKPIYSNELLALSDAMNAFVRTLEGDRIKVFAALPDGSKVADLFYDPSWNHRNLQVQLSFAPSQILDEESELKNKIERRHLRTDLELRSALQSLPSHWLAVIYRNLELGDASALPRSRIIAAIVALLSDAKEVKRVYEALTNTQKQALQFVLSKGGAALHSEVSSLFGDDYIDGYWWDVHPPQTDIGKLRALGFLFVGRLTTNGKKGVVVPLEIRAYLRDDAITAFDNVIVFPLHRRSRNQKT